uniref:Aquaporin n=1 Tax=Timspurckia oligopyrenoides TaxID=708627 RepID=A0A7S1ETM3_9RHOD|mmetsp:Transcript_6503/g.11627  ORF Transcript_6503/g.11627 Transcript_6503/m.11627 type:complete len:332 (+) Transcript_6503:521-1516(+)
MADVEANYACDNHSSDGSDDIASHGSVTKFEQKVQSATNNLNPKSIVGKVKWSDYSAAMHNEVRSAAFWLAVGTEFLATFLFVWSTTATVSDNFLLVSLVGVAMTFGLMISVGVYIWAPISGGHFNPAVSIALACTMDITILRAFCYTIAQLCGSLLASIVNYGLIAAENRASNSLGSTYLVNEGLSTAQGFGFEVLTTFIFILTIYATIDPGRSVSGGFAALYIGIAGLCCHLISASQTNTGINPARSFGPNVLAVALNGRSIVVDSITGRTVDMLGSFYWIYWIGPIVGAISAAGLYVMFFTLDDRRAGDNVQKRLKAYQKWQDSILEK